MIAKHTVGRGFRGVLAYLFREKMVGREREAVLLGGNMSGRHAQELAREFAVFRLLNPTISRPVFHASLRLPTHEQLTDDQWRGAAREYLAHLGYTETAYVVVRHPENHIHVVASRVRFDGTAVVTWKDRWRGLAAMEAIERHFGLTHPTRPTPATREREARAVLGEPRVGASGRCVPTAILADRRDEALGGADGIGNIAIGRGPRERLSPRATDRPAGDGVAAGDSRPSGSLPLAGVTSVSAPPSLVGAARDSLAQHGRWNGHLGEAAVARLAATQLIGCFPQVSVPTVLAALEATRPGVITRRDGGEAALVAQLGGLIEARLAAACIHEEGEYPTR